VEGTKRIRGKRYGGKRWEKTYALTDKRKVSNFSLDIQGYSITRKREGKERERSKKMGVGGTGGGKGRE